MADVFISYVEEDGDVALALASELTSAGYSCWYYQRSSLPGPSYLEQIAEAIAQAQVVVLVLSPRTLESHQVDKEINYAHECAKPFLPVTRDLAWGEFQLRRPTWRMAIGTATAISTPPEGVGVIVPAVVQGLQAMRVVGRSRGPEDSAAPRLLSDQAPEQVASLPPPRTPPAVVVERRAAPDSLPTRVAFVGRTKELEFLKAEYDIAASGAGGRLIFISGEPGVGKTRLAQEVGLYAWGKGGVALEGTYLRGGTAPYGAWVDALRPGLRGLTRAELSPVVELYGVELAQLFPEIAGQAAELPPKPPLAPEEQRRRLLDGLAELVIAISRRTPVVLVLNDLQWAPALAVLAHVARRLSEARALVIGTYREHELKEQPALLQEWAELHRARLATQLSLQPLEEDETARLIAHYVGDEPSRQLSPVLHRRTRGNAFFLEEVLRSLLETGAVQAGAAGWHVVDVTRIAVPESVRLVVEERVGRLGEPGRELLIQAAVLGQEFSLPALLALAGRSEDEVLQAVENAMSARLLVDRSIAGEERFAFADDQVQEVLYGGVTPLRRRRLHLRAGQALEVLYAGRQAGHVEELARHYYAGNDLPKALHYALEAGERAYAAAGFERAIHHFETALELLEELPDDTLRRTHVLERLADLEDVLGRPGLRYAEAILELYTRSGDKKRAARTHRVIARAWTTGTAGPVDHDQALAHFEAGVALLATEPDSPEKAFCYSGLANGLMFGRLDLDRALQCAREAVAIAERLDDVEQIAYASTSLALPLAYRGELAEAEQQGERSWQTALQGRTSALNDGMILSLAMQQPWAHDRTWAERWLERYFEYRRRSQVERLDRLGYGLSALVSSWLGRPDEARTALRRIEEANARYPGNYPYMLCLGAAAQGVLGNDEPARLWFDQALEASKRGGRQASLVEGSIYYGRFHLAREELAKAEAVLHRAYQLARDHGSIVQELNLLPLLCELHVRTGQLSRALDDLGRARAILTLPQEWRGQVAAVHRADGLLATANGDWSPAEHAFQQALDAERRYGFLYHEAHILVPWAELYFQRNEPGDRESGLEKLDQALAIFEQCHARADLETIRDRRATI